MQFARASRSAMLIVALGFTAVPAMAVPDAKQIMQKAQAAFTEANTALQKDTGLYKRIAKLQPNDVNTQFHYAQLADITGDTTAAIKAYKQVVKLAPTDPSAQQAKQRIAVLSLAKPR